MSTDAVPETELVTTRASMRVGDVSFELEWFAGQLRAPLGHPNQWQVCSGIEFTGYRDTLEEATRLALEAAPVLAALHEARARVGYLAAALRDLGRDPTDVAAEETTDDPPF